MLKAIQRNYNLKVKIMLGIMLMCIISITANVSGTLKEIELKKQFSYRDYAIKTQLALLTVDSSIGITYNEIIEDSNRIAGIQN